MRDMKKSSRAHALEDEKNPSFNAAARDVGLNEDFSVALHD